MYRPEVVTHGLAEALNNEGLNISLLVSNSYVDRRMAKNSSTCRPPSVSCACRLSTSEGIIMISSAIN